MYYNYLVIYKAKSLRHNIANFAEIVQSLTDTL